MFLGRRNIGILAAVFSIGAFYSILAAKEPSGEEKTFIKLLEGAYHVTCTEVEALDNFYLPDAEIINNGRQITLDETIQELKQSLSPLTGLSCSYQPNIRASRLTKNMAYLVVRETIRITSHETGEQQIDQVCTYVFSKSKKKWKIAHDHCSSVQGLSA